MQLYKKYFFAVLYAIVFVVACVAFVIYIEPLIAFAAMKATGCDLTDHFQGYTYLYVSILIVFNIILGSTVFGFNSTKELVSKIKAQKLLGKVNRFYIFFLTLRFYLTAASGSILVCASLYTSLLLIFNKFGTSSTLDASPFIFILLLLIHFIISYFGQVAKGQIFLQALTLVLVNWVFLVLSLKGCAFESLTISGFSIGASIVVAIICQWLGPNNYFLQNANLLAFRFIGKEHDSVRKRLASLRRIKPYGVFAERHYFLSLYSFISFIKAVCWAFDNNSNSDQKLIIGDPYFVSSFPTLVFVILIGVFLTFMLLLSAARYNYSPFAFPSCFSFRKSKGKVEKQRYYVPFDFCVLYGGLIKPLIDISCDTWLVVYKQSLKGFGLTLFNPAAICIENELPHYVMYIASPAESLWNWLSFSPQTVANAFDFSFRAKAGLDQAQTIAKNAEIIAINNARNREILPMAQVLKSVATNPLDIELIETFETNAFINTSSEALSQEESLRAVAVGNAAMSELINTSDMLREHCPVSPETRYIRPEEWVTCLQNATEKARTIAEVVQP